MNSSQIQIEYIDTGYFYADGGAMFGAIPKTAWKRRYICNEENKCVLAMRSLLIRTPEGKVILIDNGAGNKQLDSLSYYQFFDLIDLQDALAQKGITPEQVTDVVLTHLHFDHCGYTTLSDTANGSLSLAFPNATHWVSDAQWKELCNPNPLEKDSYFRENLELVKEKNKLQWIKEDCWLTPAIHIRLFDGHTKGQLVPYIHTEKQTYVFAGDVIPLAANVSPEWISAYDLSPLTSYYEKVRMLEEAVKEKQAIIYCHDAYTICTTIKKVNEFYKPDATIPLD